VSLRLGILGLLTSGPLHGYEVKQQFEEILAGTWDLNIGSVYQMLQRLERDGLVQPSGSRGDRGRQEFVATEEGRRLFDEWLDNPDKQPELLREEIYVKVLLLALQREPDTARILKVLDNQRHAYLQRLRDLADQERAVQGTSSGQTGSPLALLFQAGRLHTEASLKWIDACVEQLSRN